MFRSLFNPKPSSSYIFSFGSVGVGKSTILAGIAKLLSEESVIRLNAENREGSLMLLGQWVKKLQKGEFPPRSRKGTIVEVDLAVEFVKGDGETIQFTFLEMSGEDLQQIDLVEGEGELGEKYQEYLQRSDVFLVVTDVMTAADDDMIIWQFFSHLANLGRGDITIGLIISKWDMMKGSSSLEKFVAGNMPQTTMWINSNEFDEVKVFPFSIGKIASGSGGNVTNKGTDRITSFNREDCKKITEWLYQII